MKILLIFLGSSFGMIVLAAASRWAMDALADWILPDAGDSPHDRLLYDQLDQEMRGRSRRLLLFGRKSH